MLVTYNYTITQTITKDYNNNNIISYCVFENGIELQILHYCNFERLIQFLKAIHNHKSGG